MKYSNLESLADGYKLIMVGTVQTGNIGGTSGAQTSFQFGRTFSQPPHVMTENSGGIIVSGARDITGTGCQILLYNPTGGTKSDLCSQQSDYLPIKIYGTVMAPAIISDVVGALNITVLGAVKLISRSLNVLVPIV